MHPHYQAFPGLTSINSTLFIPCIVQKEKIVNISILQLHPRPKFTFTCPSAKFTVIYFSY